jgi:hypothetical protein
LKKRTPGTDPVIADRKTLPLLITAVIVAVLVNVIFFLTYPINVSASPEAMGLNSLRWAVW